MSGCPDAIPVGNPAHDVEVPTAFEIIDVDCFSFIGTDWSFAAKGGYERPFACLDHGPSVLGLFDETYIVNGVGKWIRHGESVFAPIHDHITVSNESFCGSVIRDDNLASNQFFRFQQNKLFHLGVSPSVYYHASNVQFGTVRGDVRRKGYISTNASDDHQKDRENAKTPRPTGYYSFVSFLFIFFFFIMSFAMVVLAFKSAEYADEHGFIWTWWVLPLFFLCAFVWFFGHGFRHLTSVDPLIGEKAAAYPWSQFQPISGNITPVRVDNVLIMAKKVARYRCGTMRRYSQLEGRYSVFAFSEMESKASLMMGVIYAGYVVDTADNDGEYEFSSVFRHLKAERLNIRFGDRKTIAQLCGSVLEQRWAASASPFLHFITEFFLFSENIHMIFADQINEPGQDKIERGRFPGAPNLNGYAEPCALFVIYQRTSTKFNYLDPRSLIQYDCGRHLRTIGKFLRFETASHNEKYPARNANEPYSDTLVYLSEPPNTYSGPNKEAANCDQPTNVSHFCPVGLYDLLRCVAIGLGLGTFFGFVLGISFSKRRA
jgi:hypothetical protein